MIHGFHDILIELVTQNPPKTLHTRPDLFGIFYKQQSFPVFIQINTVF